MLTAAQDQLAANAVPFPLRQPVRYRPKLFGRGLELVGEVERVGPREIGAGVRRLDQAFPGFRLRAPIAHQSVRQFRLGQASCLRQGPGHELLAHAHPPATGQQLVEHQPLGRRQTIPDSEDMGLAVGIIGCVERAQLGDGFGQALRAALNRRRQDQRDGFAQIAHDRVAFLEQPERDARPFRGPVAQPGGGDQPARAPPAQQCHAPEPVGFWRLAEILRHRRHLDGGFGRLIETREERGKAVHLCCDRQGGMPRLKLPKGSRRRAIGSQAIRGAPFDPVTSGPPYRGSRRCNRCSQCPHHSPVRPGSGKTGWCSHG